VLFRIIGENLELEEAIARPRIHLEPTTEGRGRLSVETVNGLDKDTLAPLLAEFPDYQLWESTNMFFGGVHAVLWDGDRTQAAGDPRRGGSAVVIGA
jgi:gamma-glutamyltranspeptidase